MARIKNRCITCVVSFCWCDAFASFILLIKTTRLANNLWCFWYDCTLTCRHFDFSVRRGFFRHSLQMERRKSVDSCWISCSFAKGNGHNASCYWKELFQFFTLPFAHQQSTTVAPISPCAIRFRKKKKMFRHLFFVHVKMFVWKESFDCECFRRKSSQSHWRKYRVVVITWNVFSFLSFSWFLPPDFFWSVPILCNIQFQLTVHRAWSAALQKIAELS